MTAPRQVGPFELFEALGAGGMGEVFKARDTRLNRFVAIKFLPESASDLARERFQREAQAIAALNHPHICTLHEVGSEGGRPYLVLELLEGETLRARLRRGAVPVEQLTDWGAQIADALDAAHRKGVLHRDLKPDNIWVGPGGHLKVLDFGLARLETPESAAPEDKTLTSPGVTLGTIPYMSPEQARGEALDARSDLFSFGAVFYEMATGQAAFPAKSAIEVMAAILKENPPPARSVRPDLPPRLEEVASRCLEKDPGLRYQSAADLSSELKRLRLSSAEHPALPAPAKPRRGLWPVLAAGLVAATGLAWWQLRPAPAPAPVHLQFRQLTFSGQVMDAVISPDGKFLAQVLAGAQGTSLHLFSIANGSDVQIVPPGDGCCQSPSFSADSNAVYFLRNRVLQAVPVLGGEIRTIAAAACSGAGFSPDGSHIAYVISTLPNTTLVVARADGSDPRSLYATDSNSGFTSVCYGAPGSITHAPAWSPDGSTIAAAEGTNIQQGRILLVSAATGKARALPPDVNFSGSDVSWLPDGRNLVFTAAMPVSAPSELWKINVGDGQLIQLTNDLQGYSSASLARNGEMTLVHSTPQYSLWTQSRPGGTFAQLPGAGSSLDGVNGLTWTPQDHLLLIRSLAGKLQLWSENADGGDLHKVLADNLPDESLGLEMAANGQIVFAGGVSPPYIWRLDGDGSNLVRLVTPAANGQVGFPSLAAGNQVVYVNFAGGDQSLWSVPLAGGTPRQVWKGFIFADGIAVSPDGNRVFAISRGAGSSEVHQPVVVRLDGGQPQVTPVGLDFKTMPPPYGWTADGRAITYVLNQGPTDNIWAFPLAGGKPYAVTHFPDQHIAAYAFSKDGRLAISRGTNNSDAVVVTGLTPATAHQP
ncbi:MAG: protein kinase domain-containing protein [Terriglobales bacterium]